MRKFEYDVAIVMVREIRGHIAVLDLKGQEGWHIAGVCASHDGEVHFVYLEREIVQNGKA